MAKVKLKIDNILIVDRRRLFALWEQEQLKQLFSYCDVDCVFDVGANNGQYARMLRNYVGFSGLIISFEPNPIAAAAARELAAGDRNWIVEEIALSTSDGEQTFNVTASPQFSSLGIPRHDETNLFEKMNIVTETVSVKTQTLTTVYRRLQQKYGFKRPFLKLDTQGYDVAIVRNAGPALNAFVGLQSELAVKKLYDQSVDFREAISIYESLGFELSAFVPNNAGHFPLLVEVDCIMVRRGDAYTSTPLNLT